MLGPKRALTTVFAVVVPLALLALWGAMLEAKGPYWLGGNLDPDYAYLLNGLNILKGFTPGHVDHPGTPVQVLVAIVVKATHALAGAGPLVDDVIRRPELYLKVSCWVMLVLFATALVAAGLAAAQTTGSVLATLAMQLLPGLSSVIAVHILCVKPEPLLAALATALAALVMRRLDPRRAPRPLFDAAGFGIIVGLAVASKITAVPLVLLPLLLLRNNADRARFLSSAAITTALATIPAWPALSIFRGLMRQIVTHSGTYGKGPPSVFDPAEYAHGLASLAAETGPIMIPLAVTAGVVASALSFRIWRQDEAAEEDLHVRNTLLATIVTQLAAFLFVARHWGAHYLIPALALSGLTAALAIHAVLRWVGATQAGRRIVAGVIGAALSIAVYREGRDIAAHRDWLLSLRERQLAIVTRLQRDFHGARVVQYYRSSSPASALNFGNGYANHRWAAWICALFPAELFYNRWDGRLEVCRDSGGKETSVYNVDRIPMNLEAWCLPESGGTITTVLQGSPLQGLPSTLDHITRLRDQLQLIYDSGVEALYGVRCR